jgi:hypothetical protein
MENGIGESQLTGCGRNFDCVRTVRFFCSLFPFFAERSGAKNMRVEAMAVEIPHVEGHPNRVPFEGVLALVNAASDLAPAGARGHRVLLTREAAEKALPSLLGMAVDYRPGWDGHDARRKIGLLTEANLVGQRLAVRGYLYARDFPDVARAIEAQRPETMGMSYELADARVEDLRAEVWKLTRVTFTGAAVLLREKAAYRGTSFRMATEQRSQRGERSWKGSGTAR